MEIKLRQENENDYKSVFQLIEKAFEKEEYSDHKEQFLVERLRKSDAFIPELSIVAEVENKIVGHILFTKLEIKNESQSFQSLALAPVSVLPEFQGKGIGSKLIPGILGHSEILPPHQSSLKKITLFSSIPKYFYLVLL